MLVVAAGDRPGAQAGELGRLERRAHGRLAALVDVECPGAGQTVGADKRRRVGGPAGEVIGELAVAQRARDAGVLRQRVGPVHPRVRGRASIPERGEERGAGRADARPPAHKLCPVLWGLARNEGATHRPPALPQGR